MNYRCEDGHIVAGLRGNISTVKQVLKQLNGSYRKTRIFPPKKAEPLRQEKRSENHIQSFFLNRQMPNEVATLQLFATSWNSATNSFHTYT